MAFVISLPFPVPFPIPIPMPRFQCRGLQMAPIRSIMKFICYFMEIFYLADLIELFKQTWRCFKRLFKLMLPLLLRFFLKAAFFSSINLFIFMFNYGGSLSSQIITSCGKNFLLRTFRIVLLNVSTFSSTRKFKKTLCLSDWLNVHRMSSILASL